MFLKKLRLHNFRNYAKEEFSFSPFVNIITGDNAQGKTNLLEAIYFLSTGRSFRTTSHAQLIKEGSSFFSLEALIEKESMEQKISIYFDETQRKAVINHTPYPSFSSLLGVLPSILFSPDDHHLISGAPSHRRRFLNIHLSQHDPLYVFHLMRYSKALKQKNELLRKKALLTLHAWEKEMAKSAIYLMQKRSEMIQEINEKAMHYMRELSLQNETLLLTYESAHSHLSSNDHLGSYLALIEKNRKKELHYGHSITGPHRDDLFIFINQKNVKDFASEGQKQTALSSIKLAEWDRLQRYTEEPPLLHLDDIGMHLDLKRSDLLHRSLNKFSQVFLTTPSLSAVEAPLTKGKVFEIHSGNIFEERELQVLEKNLC